MNEDIRSILRDYVIGSSLWRRSDALVDSTPLWAHGLLDSIAALELVLFIETRFGIEFSARELARRHLETIEHIEAFIREKLAATAAGSLPMSSDA